MSQRPSRLRLEHLTKLSPLTKAQKNVFSSYKEGFNLVLSGSAGTGKTFISTYLALEEIMLKEEKQKTEKHSKMLVIQL